MRFVDKHFPAHVWGERTCGVNCRVVDNRGLWMQRASNLTGGVEQQNPGYPLAL